MDTTETSVVQRSSPLGLLVAELSYSSLSNQGSRHKGLLATRFPNLGLNITVIRMVFHFKPNNPLTAE